MFFDISENLKSEDISFVVLPSSFLRNCRHFDGAEAHVFAKVGDPGKRHEAQQSSPKPSKLRVWGHKRKQEMAHLNPRTDKISSFRPCAIPRNILLLSTEMAPNPEKNEFPANLQGRWPKLVPRRASNS